MQVWCVCQLNPTDPKQFTVNGIYTSLKTALAACTDKFHAAVQMQLDTDYTNIFDFVTATPIHD